MEYKAASESVLLTARELVALLHSDTEDAAAAPGFNTLSVCPELRASVTGSGSPVSFHCPLEAGGHRFELRAEADAVTDGGLLFLRLLPDDAPPPPEAPLPHGDADDPWDREIRLARAEAYCAAWLYRIASGSENRRSPTPLRILWLSRDGVERHRLRRAVQSGAPLPQGGSES